MPCGGPPPSLVLLSTRTVGYVVRYFAKKTEFEGISSSKKTVFMWNSVFSPCGLCAGLQLRCSLTFVWLVQTTKRGNHEFDKFYKERDIEHRLISIKLF